MSSILDWSDAAHSRLDRTVRWGDELLSRLRQPENAEVFRETVGEIADWHESTAFFVNFLLDGNSGNELETLGYDPTTQEPRKQVMQLPPERIEAEFGMRVTLLRKWYQQIVDRLDETETLHGRILKILEAKGPDAPILCVKLQTRLRIETPSLRDALDYMQRQQLIRVDAEVDTVVITKNGILEHRILMNSQHKRKHGRPSDLVFLSYAREDFDTVNNIHAFLDNENYNTWWDHKNLIAGQDWRFEIEAAIEQAAVCLIFLSHNSVSKTGFVNKEITRILDRMETMPEGKVFILPIRLDNCQIPRRLRTWHVLDYSDALWQADLRRAVNAAL